MSFSAEFSRLQQLAEKRISEVTSVTEPRCIYDPFRYIMESGGKRIRPVLTMLCAGAAGGTPEDALDPAIGIEIMHNFTLVHDDIMDQSSIRRGRETIHKKWNEPTAILTGDLMVGYAYSLMPCDIHYMRNGKVIKAFTRALINVCEGQALDMQFNNDKSVHIEDYLDMINKKTGKLLETCAIIGCAMAGASEEATKSLQDFAMNAGIAFQIQDDLLDMISSESKLGKPIGKDILEGKKTFLILHAKDNLKTDKHRRLMNEFYKNDGLPENRIDEMRELFEETGAFEKAKTESEKYFGFASDSLSALQDNVYVGYLRDLLKMLNKRKF